MNIFFLIFLFISSVTFADNSPQLFVEVATTHAQQEWGLMNRRSLPENQGMLFIYPTSRTMNFWMFNTFIDLSIAFIDHNNIVREIYFMKSYPEKMDPKRPVKKLSDIALYSDWGPEKSFFIKHSTTSQGQYPYALETNAGWFDQHGVKIGDRMVFDKSQNQITFKH